VNLPDIEAEFSANRLGGEAIPEDLRLLLVHHHELAERTGVELSWLPGWAPWLDTSYLTAADRKNPDIAANVRAIADVCALSTFVAAHEDQHYFGYWRGSSLLRLEEAVPISLDNEGQFAFCGTTNVAGAILSYSGGSRQFEELHDWFQSLGIGSLPTNPDDLSIPRALQSPSALHEELYRNYLVKNGSG
jgi:hypothetical protein